MLRHRRKIFNIPNVENRFKFMMENICEEVEIIAIECVEDHTHIFLSCPETLSPADII